MTVLFIIACLALVGVSAAFALYVRRENRRLAEASETVRRMVSGDVSARLACSGEHARDRLFHDINALAAVLSAHADTEQQAKVFLKNSMQDISHQLKTPLSSLSIYQELLRDETLDDASRRRFLLLSGRELERMELLVQNLLKLTKLDSDTDILDRRETSAAALLCKTRERFAVRAAQEEKTLVTEELSGPLTILCDPMWPSEALVNLVKNALEHTRAGDTITLQSSLRGGEICLQVRDTGSGIHPEDIYHIFKRFYRSRFSQDKNGIGLGLALVRSVAEHHGGSAEVESTLGAGSVFSLYFPISDKTVG